MDSGAIYGVREARWRIAVVTGRFALPSLMFYDLSPALTTLADSPLPWVVAHEPTRRGARSAA